MNQTTSTARAYIDTWNETDATARRALLAAHWSDDAHYVDPMMQAAGTPQIDGLVAAVQQRFPAFRFRLLGTPDGHGDHVRLAWELGVPGQDAPVAGSDVIELHGGRIRRVIGFIDRVPPGAA